MAIAVDLAKDGSVNALSTNSYTHLLASDATLLVVEVLFSTNVSLNSITYGGVAPSGSLTNTSFQNYTVYLKWWFNPPTGTNTILSTLSGNPNVGHVIRSCSYTGVGALGPDTQTTGQTSASTFNATAITPTYANSWVIGILEQSAVAGAAGTGTTFRAGVGNGDGIFDTNGPVSVSTSLQATCSPAQVWTGTLAAFAPIQAGGSTPRIAVTTPARTGATGRTGSSTRGSVISRTFV